MNEPSALEKAEAAVSAAETDTVAVQLALAAVELAKAATAQQQAPAQPAPAQQEFNAAKWLVIGGVVVTGGSVLAFVAVALTIALAIGATVGTVCLLILRAIWRDLQRKG